MNYDKLIDDFGIALPDNEPKRNFKYKKIHLNDIASVDFSVVLPVFNQDSFICKNIESILKYTQGSSELIIILDFCIDNSLEKINIYFDNYENKYKNFKQVSIIDHSDFPIFESSCDNLGFMLAEGKFCLEIQGDQEMIEPGYNLQLARPFDSYRSCIGVSGRCTHARPSSVYPISGFKCSDPDTPLPKDFPENVFISGETCNRGPLLIDRAKIIELNFLDEKNFPLVNSEHDFFMRAKYFKNYICGYMPINFNSPGAHGGSRIVQSLPQEAQEKNAFYLKRRLTQRDFKPPLDNLIDTGFMQSLPKKMPKILPLQTMPLPEFKI
jgi:glycosyltransferase involved in cell wall biosynthesis